MGHSHAHACGQQLVHAPQVHGTLDMYAELEAMCAMHAAVTAAWTASITCARGYDAAKCNAMQCNDVLQTNLLLARPLPCMLALVVLLPSLGAAVPSLLAGPSPAARSRPSGSSSASTRYMAAVMACRAGAEMAAVVTCTHRHDTCRKQHGTAGHGLH